MRNEPPKTPLMALLRELATEPRRAEMAKIAGTTVGYLYQLAGCYPGRCACRSDLALRIAQASTQMRTKYGTTAITMETLATMCPKPVGKKGRLKK